MSPTLLFTLLFALGLGTTTTFASSHWFLAWMGLEINTLAILPLMAQSSSPRAVEAALKYFLTQAAAAATLLFAALSNAWCSGQWDIQNMTHPVPVTLLTLAIGFKLGLAPMHIWLSEVMQGLSLNTGLVLATWQKLAPLSLLVQIHHASPQLLIMLGFASILIGGWGGLNQIQVRKILAYSSIAHLGWMVLVLPFSTALTGLALLTYITMTSSTFLVFKYANAININSLASSWSKVSTLAAFMPLILFSLGGLPPLSGFMPKWLILQELAKQNLAPIATLAALAALLSLFFYLRLAYAFTLTIPPNIMTNSLSWHFQPSQAAFPLAIFIMMALALLPLTPSIMALLI
uniref:NADH-ubiquinone oxidoreductase chain 2 n=1 Tax=Pennahia aneus TaxID=3051908 RepID=A0A888YT12_9TELE|nr:NADH dehydrogenase subunit 2 [Pennahia anea]